jgi:hypothetical protein
MSLALPSRSGGSLVCRVGSNLRAGDHDQANWHSVHTALRCIRGCLRLDEPFFVFRSHCDYDLVRREGRERVTDREFDVRFPSDSLHRLAGKLLGCTLGHALGVRECALVVGEPVEDALPDDGYDDLDPVGVADLGAKSRFGVFDRADDQDVSHARNLPRDSPDEDHRVLLPANSKGRREAISPSTP